MINRIVVWGIGIFFALGAADYLLGGKMGLGRTFEKTLHKMGLILMGVMGVYSLAPVLAQFVTPVVTPLAGALGLDPSVFPAMLFPIDMGGYQLAMDAAKDADMGLASAVLTSSICGATVGYTITVAVTVVDKKHHGALAKGILSGMVGVPVGCLAGALMCGVNPMTALYNTLPLCVLAALLAWGLFKKPELMTRLFVIFGRILSCMAIVGLTLQALQHLLKIEILPGMADIGSGLKLVATIIFSMTGAMCLMEVLKKVLRKPLHRCAVWMGINDNAVAGMLASLVSVTLAFTQAEDMDERGLIVVCAVCATVAHVIGGQFGVVAELAPQLITPFVAGKFIAGAAGVAVALLLTRKKTA